MEEYENEAKCYIAVGVDCFKELSSPIKLMENVKITCKMMTLRALGQDS